MAVILFTNIIIDSRMRYKSLSWRLGSLLGPSRWITYTIRSDMRRAFLDTSIFLFGHRRTNETGLTISLRPAFTIRRQNVSLNTVANVQAMFRRRRFTRLSKKSRSLECPLSIFLTQTRKLKVMQPGRRMSPSNWDHESARWHKQHKRHCAESQGTLNSQIKVYFVFSFSIFI